MIIAHKSFNRNILFLDIGPKLNHMNLFTDCPKSFIADFALQSEENINASALSNDLFQEQYLGVYSTSINYKTEDNN